MGSSKNGRKELEAADIVSSSEYAYEIALEKWGIDSWECGVRRKVCVCVSVSFF